MLRDKGRKQIHIKALRQSSSICCHISMRKRVVEFVKSGQNEPSSDTSGQTSKITSSSRQKQNHATLHNYSGEKSKTVKRLAASTTYAGSSSCA
eukprot:4484766-Pleurochrysis_carterae.AAC.5